MIRQIQQYLAAQMDNLARMELELQFRTDMDAWVSFLGSAPAIGVVNPTFDPRYSSVNKNNSFWLDITADGKTISCIAARLFKTEDFRDVVRSQRLWYDSSVKPVFSLSDDMPEEVGSIKGLVGHTGGFYVHPDYRGRSLSRVVPQMARALCLREFDEIWHTGVVLDHLYKANMPSKAYTYPHVVPMASGYFPPAGKEVSMHLMYASQTEMHDQISQDLTIVEEQRQVA